jgi:catechol 1,2-dioxygenase
MGSQQTNASAASKYDPHFTQSVLNAIGPKASPRVRQVTSSLIQHLHDFARENDITVDEFMAGLELVNAPRGPSRPL